MVTRFSPGVKYSTEMGVYSPSMNVRSGGNYTLYDDYAKLETENKALKDILKKAYRGFSDDNPDLAFELLDDNRDLIL